MWDSFIKGFTAFDSWLNGIVWGWPMIILILGTGILLTIRTRVMQVRKFGNSINSTIVPTVKAIGKKKTKDSTAKSVSQFEAFATAISGTVGTGNIVGVTSAILTGGPGAVFWMWISAFFGMITNYAENVLGLYYRKRDEKGNFSGGPFYYITHGVGWKWLGYVAAIFCVLAAIGMSGVQTNKISGTITEAITGADYETVIFDAEDGTVDDVEEAQESAIDTTTLKLVVGVVVAVVVALVIIGGIKRIGRVASLLVPFMSLLFIILAITTAIMHIDRVPSAFGLIFSNIFSFQSVAGGVGGFAFSQIIKKGMARGVFSNEAGLGSSVIAHSASETREPVKQGLWGIFEVFFDTFIICTLTAVVILTTFTPGQLFSTELVDSSTSLAAFHVNFGFAGTLFFAIILPLFAVTTILAWSYYGEKATEFLFSWTGEKGKKIAALVFKIIYVLMIVASAVMTSDLVWSVSDTCNGLMAIPNLIGVVILSGTVVKITKNYYDRKAGKDVEPMLSAYPEQNAEFIKDLNEGIGNDK